MKFRKHTVLAAKLIWVAFFLAFIYFPEIRREGGAMTWWQVFFMTGVIGFMLGLIADKFHVLEQIIREQNTLMQVLAGKWPVLNLDNSIDEEPDAGAARRENPAPD